MKLTLRKASQFEQRLNALISKEDASMNLHNLEFIECDTLEDIEQVHKKFSSQMVRSVNNMRLLVLASSEIRMSVCQANEKAGINTLLCQKAGLTKECKVFEAPLKLNQTKADLKVAQERHQRAKEFEKAGNRNGYARISVPIFDEDLTSQAKVRIKEIRQELDVLEEKLAHLNLSNHIELSAKTVETLKQFDLI